MRVARSPLARICAFRYSAVVTTQAIGRYRIVREIGRGGMAIVYEARDPNIDRAVAVKVLPPAFTHDLTFRMRFKREAKTIAALEHSAIVPIYDYGEDGYQPFIVMRLMEGGSLADRLRRGPLPLGEIKRILDRVSAGIDFAHGRGVIHRDLKPENFLFDGDDQPCIVDFGIAKLLDNAAVSLTRGGLIGTPAYMSPEHARGDGEFLQYENGRAFRIGGLTYLVYAPNRSGVTEGVWERR
jgi:serine/threonine-protein kinase